MNNSIRPIALATFILLSVSFVSAQSKSPKTPAWISDKGYWVVESNIHQPLDHTIRFYTTGNVLVYKESVTGMRLNPERKKIKMKLKQVLEASVTAWETKKIAEENKQYVAAMLR